MSHWTQKSAKDFAYDLSLDFFTQLEDRFDESELLRKEFADKLQVTAGRISQIFNSPPENPKVDSLVRYAQAVGLKVSIVAYNDDDPTNDKGPVFSGVIAKCWEQMGKPRDLSAFIGADSNLQSTNWLDSDMSFNAEKSQKRKTPQSQQGAGGGDFNKAEAAA
jgi:transcriptional regulator with XRE-family HTH domain